MKLEFKNILNKHKGKTGLVIAHGKSLDEHLDKLNVYKHRNFIFFDCNDWYNFHNFNPDYWVFANNVETIEKNCTKLNNIDSCVVYADSVDLTNRDWIENNLKCNYLPYDQRHFESRKCGCGRCCSQIIDSRLTIQEELQKYTDYNKHYGTGDTVTLHMIALSILLGCNPVYIVGFDLDYKKGYAKSKVSLRVPQSFEIEPYMERIMKDIDIINESAKNIGVELINLNKNSKFKNIEIGEIK